MPASTSENLDLTKLHNYALYFLGIAVESAAVLALLGIACSICVLGFWLF
jgi:hypothetical protein